MIMKNPNGYGTIQKLSGPRRKPWAVLLPAEKNTVTLKRERKLLGCYEKREQAMNALADWHNNGVPISVERSKITLKQLRDEFVKIKYTSVSDGTQRSYDAAWKWLSALHDLPVRNIRSGHFQAVIDKAAGEGKSRATMEMIKAFASLLEDYAMQNDIINKNYAHFIVLPKSEQKEKDRFSDLDLAKIEKAAQDGVMYADVILIMCYTGWRISELLELTRFSYDAKQDTLTGGKKTAAGKNRVIPVHPKIKPYLEKWIGKGGDTIICREESEPALTTAHFRKYWYYPTLEHLGIEQATPHTTRHTFVSLLHKAGVDKWDIQRLAGHSSGEVTNKVYTHVDISQLKSAVNMLK